MKSSAIGLAFICAGVLFAAAPGNAAVLFSQPTDLDTSYASQNDPGGMGNFATAYDDFTLGSSAVVDTVKFTGSYFNPSTPGSITGFTLTFYDNNSGPGTAVFTQTVSGNGGETSLGPDDIGNAAFSYSIGLAGGFNATGGTAYWLSIVPDLAFPPQWGWESAGDGSAVQDFQGTRSTIADNLAFELDGRETGTPVPEPMTLALFGAGLLGLAGLRRSRKAIP
jgi:hypothetical protein